MDARWQRIKNRILGKSFNLSVVFADDNLLRKLNRKYRGKDKSTAVLSFRLTEKDGEIFINKKFAKKRAYFDYLFIHSLLHLKGFRHGKKMEKEEEKLINKVYGQKHYNGN